MTNKQILASLEALRKQSAMEVTTELRMYKAVVDSLIAALKSEDEGSVINETKTN